MTLKINKTRKLSRILLEASTACQLECRSCPTASGETGKNLGVGFLKFDDFKRLVDTNPSVSSIELSNWGEIFLNKDLSKIIKYAYKRNVALYAQNGTNLNHVTVEVLENLVKYRFRALTCSVDGASQETYSTYRIKGDFTRVMDNIKTINKYKALYGSPYPVLYWQYVVFGYNEHEIPKARKTAVELNMNLRLKLSWDDFYSASFSPVNDKELVRFEMETGVANRTEYRERYGKEFMKKCCLDLWKSPQINFNGRLLGCSVNYWGDYGNVFKDGLAKCLNNEKLTIAKEMIMGKIKAQPGIPCTQCKVYHRLRKLNDWVSASDIMGHHAKSRRHIFLENKLLGDQLTDWMVRRINTVKNWVRAFREIKRSDEFNKSSTNGCASSQKNKRVVKLCSGIYPLELPLAPDEEAGWKGYPIFTGRIPNALKLSCHVSVLTHNSYPHPPHKHKEEEILLLMAGELDVILPQMDRNKKELKRRLSAGQLLYYPANTFHTIHTVSQEPATYMMFKWYNDPVKSDSTLSYGQFNFLDSHYNSEKEKSINIRHVFEGPTACLKKLHCHTSSLEPGISYDPHIDRHDVVIIMLQGEVETLDKLAGPHSVIFNLAGKPHGIRNSGQQTARYVVFEFHRWSIVDTSPLVSSLSKSTNPRRWKRKLRNLFS